MEVELEEEEMAVRTSEVEKGEKFGSRGWFLWSLRMSLRVFLQDLCLKREVKRLQKELAIEEEVLRILGPNDIGWFGGMAEDLPERDFSRDQYLEGLELWWEFDRVSSQRWRADWEKAEDIFRLRSPMSGSVGSFCLMRSRWAIRETTSGGVKGEWFLRKPAGMECEEAERRIFRKVFSSLSHEVGGGMFLKDSSVSRVKFVQFAFLKLK